MPSVGRDAVIGVDIGTTSAKAVAFTIDGAAHAGGQARYELSDPHPGWAEQDPEAVLAATLEATAEAVRGAREAGLAVQGLAFSAAMHSLIALDGDTTAITPVLTWADARAADQARRLRSGPRGLALHRRTGTPVHPMSPLVKLRWYREHDPELARRARYWVGVKELVLQRLTGELVVDHGIASATGMFNLGDAAWDDEALDYAGVRRDQLARLVPTTEVLRLSAQGARALNLPAGMPVVAGCERRAAGEPRPRRRAARHGGLLDRHERRPARGGRPAARRQSRQGLLLRARAGALRHRWRGQQRRRRARLAGRDRRAPARRRGAARRAAGGRGAPRGGRPCRSRQRRAALPPPAARRARAALGGRSARRMGRADARARPRASAARGGRGRLHAAGDRARRARRCRRGGARDPRHRRLRAQCPVALDPRRDLRPADRLRRLTRGVVARRRPAGHDDAGDAGVARSRRRARGGRRTSSDPTPTRPRRTRACCRISNPRSPR